VTATAAPPQIRPHDQANLVEVDDVKVHFPIRGGVFQTTKATVKAVDGVTFDVRRGETLGLVGESGSGKSTTGRAIVQVEPLTAGDIRLDGKSLTRLRGRELRAQRHRFQMIFQDPYGSLNPRHTVQTIVAEPLLIHEVGDRTTRRARVKDLLNVVGLDPSFTSRYPFALSGGQRQRVAIARALSAQPDLIVCDEPVSALDVSIQAQIVNLLKRLQTEFDLAYLFIAHDLAVVRHIADRVAVMYLGTIVELATSDELYVRPLHPYTQALLSAIPVPNATQQRRRSRIILKGDIPSPANPPSGCRFHTRCWLRERLGSPEVCRTEEPLLVDHATVGGPTHEVACHFVRELVELAPSGDAIIGTNAVLAEDRIASAVPLPS
jgi:oligopeptide/dipeptide ABC transporter ATP-binding protein